MDDKSRDEIDKMLNDVLGNSSPGDFPGLLTPEFMARCRAADKETLLNLIEAMRDDINHMGMMVGVSLTAFTVISEALSHVSPEHFPEAVVKQLAVASEMANEVYDKSQSLNTISIGVTTIPVDPADKRSAKEIIDEYIDKHNPEDNDAE